MANTLHSHLAPYVSFDPTTPPPSSDRPPRRSLLLRALACSAGLSTPVVLLSYVSGSVIPGVLGLVACLAMPKVRAMTMALYLIMTASAAWAWSIVVLGRDDDGDVFAHLGDQLLAQQLRSFAIGAVLGAVVIGAGALDRLLD